jgi:RNA polymerase sigma factor (sigma-70 family)
MEVKGTEAAVRGPRRRSRDVARQPLRAGASRALSFEQTGQALGEWQRRELRVARGYRECWGMSAEQLEDLYQDTVLALLGRRYANEEHLRNALRTGLKHRALNLRRNECRRWEILNDHAAEIRAFTQARDPRSEPEHTTLIHQDRLIAIEFLAELTELERRVFSLSAEGMRYPTIALVLGIAPSRARKAARAFERKRERFQLLYDAGRLCGFCARTIRAMQNGEAISHELAQRALAHLARCSHCRAEYETNAGLRHRTALRGHAHRVNAGARAPANTERAAGVRTRARTATRARD